MQRLLKRVGGLQKENSKLRSTLNKEREQFQQKQTSLKQVCKEREKKLQSQIDELLSAPKKQPLESLKEPSKEPLEEIPKEPSSEISSEPPKETTPQPKPQRFAWIGPFKAPPKQEDDFDLESILGSSISSLAKPSKK